MYSGRINKNRERANNSENRYARVMVLVHCTPPQWDLLKYLVSRWYIFEFSRYALAKRKYNKWCVCETLCPLLSDFDPYIRPLTLKDDLDSKCAAPWDTHACQISSCYLQYCKSYGQC